MKIDIFKKSLELHTRKNNIELTQETNISICKYLFLLNKWNKIHNDVRNIRQQNFDVIVSRAFSDCLKFLSFTEEITSKNALWMIMTTVSKSLNVNQNSLDKINFEVIDKKPIFIDKNVSSKEIVFFKKLLRKHIKK